MATVASPPPDRAVVPLIYDLSPCVLHRVYDPAKPGALAASFRHVGPFARFDHHFDLGDERRLTLQPRGILYCARHLTGAIAEVFGSVGGGEAGTYRCCAIAVQRDLRLLDLRGNGALRAGTIGAVASQSYRCAQEWSRWFYESIAVYGSLDGIIYPGAHNYEDIFALYERAAPAIAQPPIWDYELRDPAQRATVLPLLGTLGLCIRLK